MFKSTRALAVIATGAFTFLSTAAHAAPAPSANPATSLSITRAATPAARGHSSRIGASVPGTTLVSIGILAALTAIVLVATDQSDSK